MRMRKKLFICVSIVVVLFACSRAPKQYNFSQGFSEIKTIEIVEGVSEKDAVRGNFDDIVVLASIPQEDWSRFMADFKAVKCKSYWGDPAYYLEGRIIKITYKDGGIELLHKSAGFYYRFNEDGIGRFKLRFFDDDQFEQLIEMYLDEFGTGKQ